MLATLTRSNGIVAFGYPAFLYLMDITRYAVLVATNRTAITPRRAMVTIVWRFLVTILEVVAIVTPFWAYLWYCELKFCVSSQVQTTTCLFEGHCPCIQGDGTVANAIGDFLGGQQLDCVIPEWCEVAENNGYEFCEAVGVLLKADYFMN